LPIEPQGLLSNLGDSRHLVLRLFRVGEGIRIKLRVMAQQVQQVRDCLKRIVDLMRN
jgi:hypothetical protein